MAMRKPGLPFPNKPLPNPTVSDVESLPPLQPNLNDYNPPTELNNTNNQSDEWWNDDNGEYYEYSNGKGEIVEPDGAIAVALWDFEGERESDLNFKKGDVITIIQRYDNGWWEGEIDGRIGDFPCNFVEIEEQDYDEDDASGDDNDTEIENVNTSSYTTQHVPTKTRSNTASLAPPLPPKPNKAAFNTIDRVESVSQDQIIRHSSRGPPIKQGFLTKKGHKRRNWKVRYFVLESHALSYYKNPGDFLAKRKPKGVVTLQRSTMVRVAPEMKRSNCFTVSGGIGLLYITAPTGEEMLSWMDSIAASKAK